MVESGGNPPRAAENFLKNRLHSETWGGAEVGTAIKIVIIKAPQTEKSVKKLGNYEDMLFRRCAIHLFSEYCRLSRKQH